MKRFTIVFAAMVLSFVVLANINGVLFALPGDDVQITVSALEGKPGDKIVFDYKYVGSDIATIVGKKVFFDGENANWTFPHTWTATPGYHTLRVVATRATGTRGTANDVLVYISGGEKEFVHPGIMNSEAEFNHIRKSIENGTNPRMQVGLDHVLSNKPNEGSNKGKVLTSTAYKASPAEVVYPHTGDNPDNPGEYHITRHDFSWDGQAAYYNALAWVATGEQRYADQGIAILNAWSAVYKKIYTADPYKSLWGSWNAPRWIYAAEILKSYKNGASGWKTADIEQFDKAIVLDFVEASQGWYGTGATSPKSGQNQGLADVHNRMLLGVYLNNQALFDQGYNYLFERKWGNNAILDHWGREITLMERAIGFKGEIMELNRAANGDFGHGSMCVRWITEIMEVIYHQGKDEYERMFYKDEVGDNKETIPTVLSMEEYWTEGYYETPYTFKTSFSGTVSSKSRNCPSVDIIYNQYQHRLKGKYPLPNTKKMMDLYVNKQTIFSSNTGWSTLTHGDLSKDIPVGVVSKSVAGAKSLFTTKISNNSILKIGYTGKNSATVKLFTPAGRMVKAVSLNGAKTISLKGLNHGLYLIKFAVDGVSETKKLLLK